MYKIIGITLIFIELNVLNNIAIVADNVIVKSSDNQSIATFIAKIINTIICEYV